MITRKLLFTLLIPIITIILLVSSFGFVVLSLSSFENDAFELVSKWSVLKGVIDDRFVFFGDDESKEVNYFQQVEIFDNHMEKMHNSWALVLLREETRNKIENSYFIWQVSKNMLEKSNDLYNVIDDSLVGDSLRGISYVGLAENFLDCSSEPNPGLSLWRFYRLNDALTDLEVFNDVLTINMMNVSNEIDQRVGFLINLGLVITLVFSGIIIAYISRKNF